MIKIHVYKTMVTSGLLMSAPFAQADLFDESAHDFSIDFVDIGDAGNSADWTGNGAVGYNYRISDNLLTDLVVHAYNSDLANTDRQISETAGLTQFENATVSLSWNEAATLVNWLNESKGYHKALGFKKLMQL